MSLDIRIPTGLLFAILGLILLGVGIFADHKMYAEKSLGINVNLWWGLVLLAFGLIMLALAWRAKGGPPKRSE